MGRDINYVDFCSFMEDGEYSGAARVVGEHPEVLRDFPSIGLLYRDEDTLREKVADFDDRLKKAFFNEYTLRLGRLDEDRKRLEERIKNNSQ